VVPDCAHATAIAFVDGFCIRMWPWVVTSMILNPEAVATSRLQMRVKVHGCNDQHTVGAYGTGTRYTDCPSLTVAPKDANIPPRTEHLVFWSGLLAAALEAKSVDDSEDRRVEAEQDGVQRSHQSREGGHDVCDGCGNVRSALRFSEEVEDHPTDDADGGHEDIAKEPEREGSPCHVPTRQSGRKGSTHHISRVAGLVMCWIFWVMHHLYWTGGQRMAGMEDGPGNEDGSNHQIQEGQAQPEVVREHHPYDHHAVIQTAGFIPAVFEGLIIAINAGY